MIIVISSLIFYGGGGTIIAPLSLAVRSDAVQAGGALFFLVYICYYTRITFTCQA
jgi:hypothetical protein